ncbi:unnamed protein product [Oncorhynchus mykiss]|uniref:Rho-GAP domain-containing protein n=1 Tax=Oncorhynchus mykiss TaxID=8022 RepID=A0A060XL94_ONCMY|nr:unnamed protein product [Oncorhynchus mykiss]
MLKDQATHEFDSENVPDLTKDMYMQDIHCVGSLCKLYFRELPNPLLTYQLYDKFADCMGEMTDDERMVKVHDVIQQLPPPHYRYTQPWRQRLQVYTAMETETTGIHSHGDRDYRYTQPWRQRLQVYTAMETETTGIHITQPWRQRLQVYTAMETETTGIHSHPRLWTNVVFLSLSGPWSTSLDTWLVWPPAAERPACTSRTWPLSGPPTCSGLWRSRRWV